MATASDPTWNAEEMKSAPVLVGCVSSEVAVQIAGITFFSLSVSAGAC